MVAFIWHFFLWIYEYSCVILDASLLLANCIAVIMLYSLAAIDNDGAVFVYFGKINFGFVRWEIHAPSTPVPASSREKYVLPYVRKNDSLLKIAPRWFSKFIRNQ